MQRTFEIDELKKAGFVVKSNFKEEIDIVKMANGSKFKLWVGKGTNAHVCIKGVEFVEIDKEYQTATLMAGEGEFMGTIFDFTRIAPRTYGYDLDMR